MSGYVYIVTNKPHGTLYIGVTNDLVNRVHEHKNKTAQGFTRKYNCTRLVWFETHPNIALAIRRKKALKRYKRQWKIELINKLNPLWQDLYDNIYQIENSYVPKPGSQWEKFYK